ncbi:MAG: pyridoxal phosphate-dependent aminotransferase [Clostridiales bacterium]|nr:pyridoxal phosphate-dependent aminotransferase [Clostridiales bacterium]
MISKNMKKLVENSSAIRAMFEEGAQLAKIYGAENVYDFSLGNPNVAAPESIKEAVIDIITNDDPLMLHGYMSNAGYEDVRNAIADSINRRFDTNFDASNIIMTVGAAGGLNVILKTLIDPGDTVLTFAPFFAEYINYVNNANGTLEAVPPVLEDFTPDMEKFEQMIKPSTKAVIINNPNNPSGVVYPAEVITKIADILEKKQKEFGTSIYLISDEPYRELAYDGVEVPYLTKYYKNTVVGYSYSKSLSLPGDRIGYLVIPSEVDDYEEVFEGASVANRVLGFVNAPSLMQRVVAKCCDEKTDIDFYDGNRKILYNALQEYGFTCVKPQGAFYLFIKSPVADEREFCAAAKKHNVLLVQGRSFGCEGYVRLSYCVSRDTVVNSLPAFKALAEEYGLIK